MSFKKIGIVLWILVLVFGAIYVAKNAKRGNSVAQIDPQHDGRVIVQIPWKRLPHVGTIQLTSQDGSDFDTADLAGKPYVVSFFFTECPTICRDMNKEIARLSKRFKNTEMTFLGFSVDAKHDTPQVLKEYSGTFEGNPDSWKLLTGKQHRIDQFAQLQLSVLASTEHHTDDIFLIDRWGRYRDRFTWDDKPDLQRFVEVAEVVLAETEPPLNAVVPTRNVMATLTHSQRNASAAVVPWLNDFQLIDQDENLFYSRDLTGSVWVASLFFSRCSSVCPRQNKWLAELQPELTARKAKLVSITTDSVHDTPQVLRTYAKELGAERDWTFLTGDKLYIERVAGEFFRSVASGEHHSSLLSVVDRWGNVRGQFDWQVVDDKQKMLDLIDELNNEQTPVVDFQFIKAEKQQP